MLEPNNILYWLTDHELEGIYSSTYWNDEEIEQTKPWYILDDTEKLVNFLHNESSLLKEFEGVIRLSKSLGLMPGGTGLDIAAGVCWTTALLSHLRTTKTIYALEISKHRLLKLAPLVLDLFEANTEKIIRVVGSFYDIKLPTESVDFCFMSAAFHHADNPTKLLQEIHRILKPDGFIMIIAESPIYFMTYLNAYMKHIIKLLLYFIKCRKQYSIKKIFPQFSDLYPTDEDLGDHHYQIHDYHAIFHANQFMLYGKKLKKNTIFVAKKAAPSS